MRLNRRNFKACFRFARIPKNSRKISGFQNALENKQFRAKIILQHLKAKTIF
jgi:hypothetical protein